MTFGTRASAKGRLTEGLRQVRKRRATAEHVDKRDRAEGAPLLFAHSARGCTRARALGAFGLAAIAMGARGLSIRLIASTDLPVPGPPRTMMACLRRPKNPDFTVDRMRSNTTSCSSSRIQGD